MLKKQIITLGIAILYVVSLPAQIAPDATKVFSLGDYLDWVRQFHPVSKQARLLQSEADAALMYAKGAFDPKIFGEVERKSFDGKDYFTIGQTGLSIPTWFGADVKLSYTWADGVFLSPENNLPNAGQAVAGIEIPLGQGLLFDARRAQVKQANLLQAVNEAERRQIMNDLFLAAIESYWNWAYAYQQVQVIDSALSLARQRFELTRESYFQGFKPAIDTVESLILIQTRVVELNDANIEYNNRTLELSNFLWYDNLIPLETTPLLRPEALNFVPIPDVRQRLNLLQANLTTLHPSLLSLGLKQNQLEIKERLKLEYLKPKVNFNYNFLANGFDFFQETQEEQSPLNTLLFENYKFGINASFPLFLRSARGDLELVRLEMTNNQLKINQKQLEILNKVEALGKELEVTFQQVETNQAMVLNYQRLLDAENEKFRVGESSIFLLNTREQKLIEAQLKLLKLKTNYSKLKGKLDWAAGQLQ